ncbi:hypothetical protein H696_02106 [Fonticula alba]|uniref:SDE2-like domain-containing protein n=1 Tax=Fonticula alba TaxID=691883 RepID=A0A058ZB47_FONAL|nr:hypothetical protein H696_02106 [Fonticula alba]KCV71156.1 hypothetical protein H696_02106 [Fonticula alba]|eukprot:XP_009494279.1 hypothetical protein H696_02106 [Fonticula alba]
MSPTPLLPAGLDEVTTFRQLEALLDEEALMAACLESGVGLGPERMRLCCPATGRPLSHLLRASAAGQQAMSLDLAAGPASRRQAYLALRGAASALPAGTVSLVPCAIGGKGGFGSMLRSQGGKMASKATTNFDACRDLSGRRLGDIRNEQARRERAEILAALERERQQREAAQVARALEIARNSAPTGAGADVLSVDVEHLAREAARQEAMKKTFLDADFHDERQALEDRVSDAVDEAMARHFQKRSPSGSPPSSPSGASTTAPSSPGPVAAAAAAATTTTTAAAAAAPVTTAAPPAKKSLSSWDVDGDLSDSDDSDSD